MENTPLQELIEYLDERLENPRIDPARAIGLLLAKNAAFLLLAKERTQFVEMASLCRGEDDIYDYFDKHFNQNKP